MPSAVAPLRVLSVGSLPPELGGARPGGVAAFHGSFLAGLAAHPARVASVGVIPVGSLTGNHPSVPLFPRPRRRPPRDHLQRIIDESGASIVVVNHVANEWGRAAVGLVERPVLVGINHSWTPLTRASDPFPVEQLSEIFAAFDAIVFPSRHCRDQGSRFGRFKTRQEVIPHPVPPKFSTYAGRFRWGIIFVGNLVPVKNVASLIEAITMVPDAPLTIVGEGPERSRLEEMVHERRLQHRVVFTGALPQPEVLPLMETAEVLCLPSHSESFGLVMVEALAVGTPVVGFGPTFSEISQEVGGGCGTPLGATDPRTVAEALIAVLSRGWDHESISLRTRNAFSNAAVIRRYVELFETLTHLRANE